MAGQTDAVGAGAFQAEAVQHAESGRPGHELVMAGGGGGTIVVPSRRPNWSSAAATWISECVSTPTVTTTSASCTPAGTCPPRNSMTFRPAQPVAMEGRTTVGSLGLLSGHILATGRAGGTRPTGRRIAYKARQAPCFSSQTGGQAPEIILPVDAPLSANGCSVVPRGRTHTARRHACGGTARAGGGLGVTRTETPVTSR
jgi:hypothetical protein